MGAFCQMAYSIGEDLFAFDNYRAVAMAEYVGKYNLIKDEAFNKGTLVGDDFVYDSHSFPILPIQIRLIPMQLYLQTSAERKDRHGNCSMDIARQKVYLPFTAGSGQSKCAPTEVVETMDRIAVDLIS